MSREAYNAIYTPVDFSHLRHCLGYTQEKLSEKLHMPVRTIQEIEGGRTPVRTVYIYAMKWLLQNGEGQ